MRKKVTTPKQQKLIKLLMENYGKQGETKSLGELLLEAGYSEETAKNPKLILSSPTIEDGIKDFLNQLDDKRRLALTKITERKLDKAPAREVAYVLDILTKNFQLLSGGATERKETIFDDEQVDTIAIRITQRKGSNGDTPSKEIPD